MCIVNGRYEILQRRILFSGVRLVVTATEGSEVCDRLIVFGGALFFDFKTHVFNPARGAL
jgi:hypothetical protein